MKPIPRHEFGGAGPNYGERLLAFLSDELEHVGRDNEVYDVDATIVGGSAIGQVSTAWTPQLIPTA